MLTAEQIMTTDTVTIGPEATIRDAIELLISRRISGLPVVNSQGQLVGILTEFALLALAYDREIANQTVAEHMTHDVLTADVSSPVNKIADQFIIHRVQRLPVVREGRLAGLVSRRDVLEALFHATAPVGAV